MSVEFDERLISAERLLKVAGGHPMRVHHGVVLALDCEECQKPIAQLTDRRDGAYPLTAGQLLQDVLRHLVMCHEVALSGRNDDG